MADLHIFLTYFLAASLLTELTASAVVRVNGDIGTDSHECLQEGIDHSLPCLSLEFAVSSGDMSSTTHTSIIIENPVLDILDVISFTNVQNVTIEGSGTPTTTLRCSHNPAGLNFNNCKHLLLAELIIEGCSFTADGLLMENGVIFQESSEVQVRNVTITQSSGYGIIFMNSVNVIVASSSFENNRPRKQAMSLSEDSTGGGVHLIMHNFSDIDTDTHSHYLFNDCSFTRNSATGDIPVRQMSKTHKGGGLKIVLDGSMAQTITISNCTFQENDAISGGGVYISFELGKKKNQVTIKDSTFQDNNAHEGYGGGLHLHYVTKASRSSSENPADHLNVSHTQFITNHGRFGGAVAIHVPTAQSHQEKKCYVKFNRCTFRGNSAVTGSAMDCTNYYSFGKHLLVFVLMFDSNFTNNFPVDIEHVSEHPGENHGGHSIGSVMLFSKTSVSFSGKNHFYNNPTTALHAASSQITIARFSLLSFENNTGELGGAMLLTGDSYIEPGVNATIRFQNNEAIYGGALCVLPGQIYPSPSTHACFIHSLHRSSRFEFKGNIALSRIAKDVFASTLRHCLHHLCDENTTLAEVFDSTHLSCLGIFEFQDYESTSIATNVNRIITDQGSI